MRCGPAIALTWILLLGGHRRGGRIVSNQTFHLVDIMPTLS